MVFWRFKWYLRCYISNLCFLYNFLTCSNQFPNLLQVLAGGRIGRGPIPFPPIPIPPFIPIPPCIPVPPMFIPGLWPLRKTCHGSGFGFGLGAGFGLAKVSSIAMRRTRTARRNRMMETGQCGGQKKRRCWIL